MRWNVQGAWKADGEPAAMAVDAPSQRAAEAIAATRGMMVESCIPEQAVAQAVPLDYGTAPAPAVMRVQTVQQTSKVWKFVQLLGVVLSIGGVVAVGVSMNQKSPPSGPDYALAFGALAILGGLLLFVIGRIFAWWFHG